MNKRKIINSVIDIIFVVCIGIIYFEWSSHLMQSWAPDEGMREDVVYWIAKNGRLPIGDEKELINPIWGFSYAFLPYLPSIIGAFYVKIISVFTSSEIAIFLAPRMVSVFAGMITGGFALKIGKRIFYNRLSDYLFASFICLLPQFVFICSYFNNDSFSVMTTVIMLYFWICGMQDGWNKKNTIGLGVGIGMCALTYYNAYGYILCSIVFYVGSWIHKGKKIEWSKFWKFGLIIAGVAIMFAGWYFIRNGIIYNGDFLGIQATRKCGEINAMEQYKPSNRTNMYNQGKTIWDMLTDGYWVKMLYSSFIGCFSFMSVLISDWYIHRYYAILLLGGIIGLIIMLVNKKTRLLCITLVFTMIIPIVLTIYNSYSADYQPQGRYVMSALPGLGFCSAYGYDVISNKIPKWLGYILIILLGLTWIHLLHGVYRDYINVYCWCNDIKQILK